MTIYISPTRRLASLRETMDRMMGEAISDSLTETTPRERELTLAVDIKSKDEGYTLRAFVPGLTSDDISIEIINNTIAIRGEFRMDENGNGAGKYIVSELPAGRFSRVLTLPTALDPSKAEAVIKDGVLTLWIPKAEAHRPKTIQVKAG